MHFFLNLQEMYPTPPPYNQQGQDTYVIRERVVQNPDKVYVPYCCCCPCPCAFACTIL